MCHILAPGHSRLGALLPDVVTTENVLHFQTLPGEGGAAPTSETLSNPYSFHPYMFIKCMEKSMPGTLLADRRSLGKNDI